LYENETRIMQVHFKVHARFSQDLYKINSRHMYITIFMLISRIRLHKPMVLQDPVKAHSIML